MRHLRLLLLALLAALLATVASAASERSRGHAEAEAEAEAEAATTSYVLFDHLTSRWSVSSSEGPAPTGPNCGLGSHADGEERELERDLWWSEGGCSGAVAVALWKPHLSSRGWDELHLQSSSAFDDRTQSYGAGFLEGFLTQERVWSLHTAIVKNKPFDAALVDFLRRHNAHLRKQVDRHAPSIFKFGDAEHLEAFSGQHKGKPSDRQAYWFGVALVLAQLDGMVAGYNARAPSEQQLTLLDFWHLNADGDKMDIERAVAAAQEKAQKAKEEQEKRKAMAKSLKAKSAKNNSTGGILALGGSTSISFSAATGLRPRAVSKMTRTEVLELVAFNGHCSALVKLTGDDLLFGHNTWTDYDEFVRMYKSYSFRFHHPSIASQGVSFTSYPGFLWSSDDFYLTREGSSLAVSETTITILDESLYEKHVSPEKGVMAWLRAILANRLAHDAKQWTHVFQQRSSGTYNDQWMVVDMNKVNHARAEAARQAKKAPKKKRHVARGVASEKQAAGAIPVLAPLAVFAPPKVVPASPLLSLPRETFFLLEQIPGYLEVRDLTAELQREGYFASYNLPYFRATNEKAFYTKYARDLKAESLVYKNATRGRIFAAEAPKVQNVGDLQRLLRLNDYTKNGSLTLGCPDAAVAARFDLDPLPGAECEIKSRRLNGAIDAKVLSAALAQQNAMQLVAGPTDQGVPAFDWMHERVDAKKREKMRSTLTATKFAFEWRRYQPAKLEIGQKDSL